MTMGKVHHLERCPKNHKLLSFVTWWDAHGPFHIVIVRGRTDDSAQGALYAQGRTVPGTIVTDAKTAAESAHGHDAAIDCHPVRELYPTGGVRLVYLGDKTRELPEVYAVALRLFAEYDRLAKEHGLETGESFPGLCDRPHAQDPAWRSLPLSTG